MANKWLDNLIDLWNRLTATRAGYLDELDFDLNARLGAPAGASLAADLLTIDNFVDDLETAVGAIEGATTLHNKLTAARAALLDQITALRMAELDAGNLPADVAALNTLLTNGTYGLAALETLVDDLETAVGAIEGATSLHNKLTAARAALLDNLDAAISTRAVPGDAMDLLAATITAIRQSVTVVGDPANSIGKALYELYVNRLTAARGDYLDNLIGTVSTGTFSLVNNILEQDAIIVAAATQLVDIELDMSNLTQINTVREYVQVDAATYRQISAKAFPTDFDTGTTCVVLSFPQKNSLYKVTLQASVLEGIARNVPWRQMVRDLS